MLIFEKQDKTCVMLLKDSTIVTYVEITCPMPDLMLQRLE